MAVAALATAAADFAVPPDAFAYFVSSVLRAFLYVGTATQLDIVEAVGELSKYNAQPTKAHINAAMRVLLYLKATFGAKLSYQKTATFMGTQTQTGPVACITGVGDSSVVEPAPQDMQVLRGCGFKSH